MASEGRMKRLFVRLVLQKTSPIMAWGFAAAFFGLAWLVRAAIGETFAGFVLDGLRGARPAG